MKIKTSLFFMLLLASTSIVSQAQTAEAYPSNISLEFLTFVQPYGEFENKDILGKSSFAKTSLSASFLSYNRKVTKKFGLSAKLGGTTNKVDAAAFMQQFSKLRPTINNSYSLSMAAAKWQTYWYQVGVFWQYPIFKEIKNSKMYFFDRIYLAYVITQYPGYDLTANSSTNQYRFSVSSESKGSFGMQAGVGLLMNILKERLGVRFAIDVYATQPTFNNLKAVEITNSVADRYTLVPVTKRIAFYTFSLGVGYNFGKSKKDK